MLLKTKLIIISKLFILKNIKLIIQYKLKILYLGLLKIYCGIDTVVSAPMFIMI